MAGELVLLLHRWEAFQIRTLPSRPPLARVGTVEAVGHRPHLAGMAGEFVLLLAGGGVPDPHAAVRGRRWRG